MLKQKCESVCVCVCVCEHLLQGCSGSDIVLPCCVTSSWPWIADLFPCSLTCSWAVPGRCNDHWQTKHVLEHFCALVGKASINSFCAPLPRSPLATLPMTSRCSPVLSWSARPSLDILSQGIVTLSQAARRVVPCSPVSGHLKLDLLTLLRLTLTNGAVPERTNSGSRHQSTPPFKHLRRAPLTHNDSVPMGPPPPDILNILMAGGGQAVAPSPSNLTDEPHLFRYWCPEQPNWRFTSKNAKIG